MSSYRFELEDTASFDEMIVQRGLDTYNSAFGLEPITELSAFYRDAENQVRGGIYGEVYWHWLYIDLVWVDPAVQHQGHGERLMHSLEQEALSRGAGHAYLSTTSFQALPFYHQFGYELFGVLEDRPPGYNYYFLKRPIALIRDLKDDDLLPTTEDPDPEDLKVIKQGLSNHNRSKGINPDGKRLGVYLRTDDHQVKGGIVGATYWGWLDIQMAWVDESLRGQGYGLKLLRMAEDEARLRGCANAFIDVADFQALGFFHRQGYVTFTRLEERPRGYTTHFLRKRLR